MRTKTILMSALCGLIGAVAANAQSVYSVNAVGYVNVSFSAGKLKLITNPLNATNTIANLFSSVAGNPTIYKWNGTSYDSYFFAGGTDGWVNGDTGEPAGNATLNPGEGAFLLADQDFTVTFVGEVMQGNSLSTPIRAGLSMVGSQVPQAGDIVALQLSQALAANASIYKWTGSDWAYYLKQSSADADWIDGYTGETAIPSLDVGEAVFVLSDTTATWTRNFSINN